MSWRLRRIAHALRRGAVIACATDTIWGLSCHPLHGGAVRRLLCLKQRPVDKGLILLASELRQARPFIDAATLPELHDRISARSDDRPTTWILPAAAGCPFWLAPDGRHVALRLTETPQIASLCDTLDSPIITTSANRSGRPAAGNRFQVARQFHDRIDAYVGSHRSESGLPSRIIDLQSGRILRP